MSNVLNEQTKQQVIALGRLGWSLRRIEAAVHIRRETIGGYLRAAGIPVRPPAGWGRSGLAKPAIYESALLCQERIEGLRFRSLSSFTHTTPSSRDAFPDPPAGGYSCYSTGPQLPSLVAPVLCYLCFVRGRHLSSR